MTQKERRLYLIRELLKEQPQYRETEIPEDKPEQLDMFTDYEALEREKQARQLAEEKERRLQNVTLAIQDKFGKNAMLKGMNLMEGGTTIARNGQIGGHKAGDE